MKKNIYMNVRNVNMLAYIKPPRTAVQDDLMVIRFGVRARCSKF